MGTRFWRTLSAYLINTIGDEFYAIALPLILLQLGYPAATATFLRTAVMASTVISGFLVGHVVDQHGVGRLLVGTYASSAAVLAVGTAAIALGAGDYPTALAVAAVLGLFTAGSAAAVDAGVPQLVPSDQVRHGYSLMESARASATVVGPACASVVAVLRSVPAVMGINAASFVVAGAIAGLRGGAAAPSAERTRQTWRQIGDGLRAILGNWSLRLGIALSLLINVALGADQPLVLTRLIREFRLPAAVTSLVVVAVGVTSIGISLGVTRWARTWPARQAMTVSAFLVGLSGAGLGAVPDAWGVAVLFCVNSAATISYTVYWRSYRQGIVAPELLGRVSATCRSLAYSGVVVGTAAVGVLQEAGVSAAALLGWGGAVCTLGVGVTAALQRRTRSGERGPAETTRPGGRGSAP